MPRKQQTISDPYTKEAVPRLISQFESLAPKKLKERESGALVSGQKVKGWRELALIEASHLKKIFPDSKPQPTYGKAMAALRMMRKYAVDNYKFYLDDPEMAGRVRTTMTHFFDALSFLFSEYKKISNEEQKQRISNLQFNRQTINPTQFIEQAEATLRMVEDFAKSNPKASLKDCDSVHWADVSCALALVTGRRMAEIHQSATFELGQYSELNRQQKLYCLEANWLWFSGQLKGKEDNNAAKRKERFPIPVLVSPHLVLLGLDYLEENGKRVVKEESTTLVNKKYSVQLMRQVDRKWRVDPRPKEETSSATGEVKKVKFSYHSLRDCWFLCAVQAANIEAFNYPMVAPSLLGHSGVGSLTSYQIYKLAEGATTHIEGDKP